MKETLTTTVTVSGRGDSKAAAMASALSRVQSTLLRSSQHILLRIEPQDVRVLRADAHVRREKFLFFFLARTRCRYAVELAVTVNVTRLDCEAVIFTPVWRSSAAATDKERECS
ncbi:DUF4312 family protein [Pantoea sp. 1.19]|uniref:DUF4312 family protein n=1 Tax=Pantoea sp. 1.19 TaxID=1925589 RepID=UPI0009491FB2|nr:DUF4312 family protein [Pantoea sp. 1.19]